MSGADLRRIVWRGCASAKPDGNARPAWPARARRRRSTRAARQRRQVGSIGGVQGEVARTRNRSSACHQPDRSRRGVIKTRRGWLQGYNAQAVVMPHLIIFAVEETTQANDPWQLGRLLDLAQAVVEAVMGRDAVLCAAGAGAGYGSQANAAHVAWLRDLPSARRVGGVRLRWHEGPPRRRSLQRVPSTAAAATGTSARRRPRSSRASTQRCRRQDDARVPRPSRR